MVNKQTDQPLAWLDLAEKWQGFTYPRMHVSKSLDLAGYVDGAGEDPYEVENELFDEWCPYMQLYAETLMSRHAGHSERLLLQVSGCIREIQVKWIHPDHYRTYVYPCTRPMSSGDIQRVDRDLLVWSEHQINWKCDRVCMTPELCRVRNMLRRVLMRILPKAVWMQIAQCQPQNEWLVLAFANLQVYEWPSYGTFCEDRDNYETKQDIFYSSRFDDDGQWLNAYRSRVHVF
jgi:hypothetical protein